MKNLLFLYILLIFLCSCDSNNIDKSKRSKKTFIIDADTSKSEIQFNQDSCLELVVKIFTTSPRYLELTNGLEERVQKNGGSGFGFMIDGSPYITGNDSSNYSSDFKFSLHETYPDRNTNFAYFKFDPSTVELSELDFSNDRYIPIKINKELEEKFRKICK